jgi:DNA-binding transcriptional ArsR family regulator
MSRSHVQSRPRRRPLSDEAIELIAARLRVIAEPTRIRLMRLLNEGDATVQDLTDRMATTHQNVSKHLGVLYQAGMVSRRKEGTSVRYSLIDWTGWWLIEQVGTSVITQLDELRETFAEQADAPRTTERVASRPRRAGVH